MMREYGAVCPLCSQEQSARKQEIRPGKVLYQCLRLSCARTTVKQGALVTILEPMGVNERVWKAARAEVLRWDSGAR